MPSAPPRVQSDKPEHEVLVQQLNRIIADLNSRLVALEKKNAGT